MGRIAGWGVGAPGGPSLKRRGQRIRLAAAILAALVLTCASVGSASAAAGGSVTLTFWEYYAPGGQQQWIQGQVKAFENANPNIKVNLVQSTGPNFDQKLLGSVSTGQTPDLFINNIVVDYPTLQHAGVMLNLTKYWNSYAGRSQFPSGAVWKTKGQVYNLLTYTNLIGLFYNETILDQYGITTPPSTLDELQQDLAKVAAGGKYGGLDMSGSADVQGAWQFAPMLLGQGVNYCNWGKSQKKVDSAFNLLADWSKKGYIPEAASTWSQTAAWQEFTTGKYAFAINGNWNLGNVSNANFKFGTTEFPAPAGGVSQVYPGGEGFAIGAKSKHPAQAWKFLEQAILSKQSELNVLADAGSIPMRADAATTPAVKNREYLAPFVKAAHNAAAWPNNPNTANMQAALGKAASAVISGQMTGPQAAQSSTQDIDSARQQGGGGC